MQRLYRTLLISVCALFALTSCTKDEGNLFDKSAPVRLSEALANAQKVLTSAENGWVMYYYPGGTSRVYGGYIYTMSFTDEEVTVNGEIINGEYTSLYSMTKDDGPVLSFDSNNYAFHFFSTPSGNSKNLYGDSGKYQAYGGDFEFMILSATKDEVVLRGKRYGSHIRLVPLKEEAETYLTKASAIRETLFLSTFNGTFEGKNINIFLSLDDRQATVTLPDDKDEEGNAISHKTSFVFTDKGICLYKPIEIGGHKLQDMIFDYESKKMTAEGAQLDVQGELPEGWHAYADFIGNYSLVYNDGEKTMPGIEIKEDVTGTSYIISGLSAKFDVTATYSLSLGRIHIQAQYVAGPKQTGTANSVMMACWDSDAGKVNYTVGGLYGILNEDKSQISWVDNKLYTGYKVDGFILYFFGPDGTRIGATTAPWFWTGRESLSSGQHQAWGWTTFDRQ